jgi:hypothetical protein
MACQLRKFGGALEQVNRLCVVQMEKNTLFNTWVWIGDCLDILPSVPLIIPIKQINETW